MPITMAQPGETVRIKRITGRDKIRLHLAELGIVENGECTLVTKNDGNVILNIKETRIALNENLANRIMF